MHKIAQYLLLLALPMTTFGEPSSWMLGIWEFDFAKSMGVHLNRLPAENSSASNNGRGGLNEIYNAQTVNGKVQRSGGIKQPTYQIAITDATIMYQNKDSFQFPYTTVVSNPKLVIMGFIDHTGKRFINTIRQGKTGIAIHKTDCTVYVEHCAKVFGLSELNKDFLNNLPTKEGLLRWKYFSRVEVE